VHSFTQTADDDPCPFIGHRWQRTTKGYIKCPVCDVTYKETEADFIPRSFLNGDVEINGLHSCIAVFAIKFDYQRKVQRVVAGHFVTPDMLVRRPLHATLTPCGLLFVRTLMTLVYTTMGYIGSVSLLICRSDQFEFAQYVAEQFCGCTQFGWKEVLIGSCMGSDCLISIGNKMKTKDEKCSLGSVEKIKLFVSSVPESKNYYTTDSRRALPHE